jgi:hypothetical protein
MLKECWKEFATLKEQIESMIATSVRAQPVQVVKGGRP